MMDLLQRKSVTSSAELSEELLLLVPLLALLSTTKIKRPPFHFYLPLFIWNECAGSTLGAVGTQISIASFFFIIHAIECEEQVTQALFIIKPTHFSLNSLMLINIQQQSSNFWKYTMRHHQIF